MSDRTIRSVELFLVPPRWLFLKLTTQGGLEGWGEPVVEGRAGTVKACVEEMASYLIGRDAGEVEDIWQTLYRGGFYRGGAVLTSAISGIEQALWDIKGKDLGLPAYDLLGGKVRDRIQIYCGIGGKQPGDVADAARTALKNGYKAIKMGGTDEHLKWVDSHRTLDLTIEKVAAVREAVGKKLDIAMDFHGRVHHAMARTLMKKLEPYNLLFVEEPVLCENEEAFLELRRSSHIPIATGERNYTRWGYKSMLLRGGVDIIQPDLSHAGGLFECRKIAAMAEAFDVAVAPHCPLGPIALAACLQLDFCTPNAFIQEQSLGLHNVQGSELHKYLADPGVLAYEDGHIKRLTGPGLGITVNEAQVREMAKTGHNWKNPVWRDPDGTVTEW